MIHVAVNPVATVVLVVPSTATTINASVRQDSLASTVLYVSSLHPFTALHPYPLHDQLGDPCADNPCLNGASCVANGIGGFTCQCPPGYTGQRCEDRECWARRSMTCSVNASDDDDDRWSVCIAAVYESRHVCERKWWFSMCMSGGVLRQSMWAPRCMSKQSVHERWHLHVSQ